VRPPADRPEGAEWTLDGVRRSLDDGGHQRDVAATVFEAGPSPNTFKALTQ
jgi:hypothetical protein